MSYLENNLRVLEQIDPSLANQVRAATDCGEKMIECAPGVFDVQLKNGKLLYDGNVLKKSEEYLAKSNLIHPKLTVMYGLGLGYVLHKFWKENLQKCEAIFLFEASLELFKYSLTIFDWAEILKSGKVHLYLGTDFDFNSRKLGNLIAQNWLISYAKNITHVFDEAVLNSSPHKDYYAKCLKIVDQHMHLITALLTGSPEDNYQAFINVTSNVFHSYGVPSFDCLIEKFRGFPGIVVSTGPSLNLSLDWLKKVQGKAVIACADSALNILLNHGIKPHLVACLERSSPTRKFFEVEHDLSDVYLISDLTVWPETYQLYKGPKINYFRPMGQQAWFFPKIIQRDGGNSVAHLAFRALVYMGCNPIMLVGQDLAYHPFNFSGHAQGIPDFLQSYDKKELEYIKSAYVSEGRGEVLVEGNNNQSILTTPVWNNFRSYFESALACDPNLKCYNVIPKEYGAKIARAEQIEPDSALKYLNEKREVISEIRNYCSEGKVDNQDEFYEKLYYRYELALENLRYLSEFALDTLDSISIFKHGHEPVVTGIEVYKPFMQKLEKIILQIMAVEGFKEKDFFGSFLLPQLQGEFLSCQQKFESFLKQPETVTRLNDQIAVVRDWMTSLHMACARMENFLSKYVTHESLEKLKQIHAEA